MFKIELNKEMLEKKLGVSCSIIGKGSRLPILNDNLFRFSGDRIEILSNNEEIEVITSMPYELLEGEVSDFVAEGRVIMQTLKYLKTETITIEIVSVPNGKLEKVIFGTPKNKKQYEIPCNYDAINFPAQNNEISSEPVVLNGSFLSESLKTASIPVNISDTRAAFTGIFMGKIEESLCFQGVNGGSIMVIIKKEIDEEFKPVIIPKSILIPIQFFITSNEVKVSVDKEGKNILFNDGTMSVYCRLIDGTYPDTISAFNAFNSDQELKINRLEFLSAVNRCGIFSDNIIDTIILDSRKENMAVSSKDTKFNKASAEEIEILSKSDTFKFRTGFSAKLLETILPPFSGDNLVISQKSEASAIIVTDDKERDYSVHTLLMYQNI